MEPTYAYCSPGHDVKTGRFGAFIYEVGKGFSAISPVCDSIGSLEDWMEDNGYEYWSQTNRTDMRVRKLVDA